MDALWFVWIITYGQLLLKKPHVIFIVSITINSKFYRFNALIDNQNISKHWKQRHFLFFKVQAYSGCAGDETGWFTLLNDANDVPLWRQSACSITCYRRDLHMYNIHTYTRERICEWERGRVREKKRHMGKAYQIGIIFKAFQKIT